MHADLPIYRDGFFERFLAELPGTPTLGSLSAQVLMGEYAAYAGAALTPLAGASITPQFVIHSEDAGKTRSYPMLWIVERIDVATDSAETMARILADFRSPTTAAAPIPAPATDEGLSSELARSWSQALASDAVRAALARNLDQVTEVPAGLPAADLEALRTFLRHFGSYKPDGTYVAKGAVAEGQFPAGASPAYLAADTGNLAELKVQRDLFYCYALVAERLWHAQAPATKFRQLLYRIEDRGSDAGAERWRLALLHTVGANEADGTASRFVFFHAAVGIGLALPDSARSAVATSTADLLEQLPAYLAEIEATLQDSDVPIVGTRDAPIVLLLGAVREGFPRTPLPDGVIEDGEGAVRSFRCPPQHVRTLAERDDVENLVASTAVGPDMQHAMNELNFGARAFGPGITPATTGHGVVVGIVDSGIDGGHPAFLGRADDATKTRIHSVWNLWESGGDSPARRSGNKAEYRSMNFGREYMGHDEVRTVVDRDISHGTHCAGIAAGRAFAGNAWPGGIAPAATIVVAATDPNGSFINDIVAGVKYCFQKATELNLPCVVNISMSTQRTPHDGTDPLAIALTQAVSQTFVPATGLGSLASGMPNYVRGRVICASAGNLRAFDSHWQATIPAGGQVQLLYRPVLTPGSRDGITFWAYNEDATVVRLRLSARHSANAVLASGEVPLMTSNVKITSPLAGGLQVSIHNGPQAPNNRHFNPEVYWLMPQGATAIAPAPWIVRLRNDGRAPCVVHGFTVYRHSRGRFLFDDPTCTALLGSAYSAAQKAQFNSHKIGSPGNAPGCICVTCFTSEPGLPGQPVDQISNFSSPGPLRAAGPGQRAIDVALPGNRISSAKGATAADPTQGLIAYGGTSMATPVMTGLTAAMMQLNPALNTGNLRVRLENAATRGATDSVDDWGLGRLDAAALLKPD